MATGLDNDLPAEATSAGWVPASPVVLEVATPEERVEWREAYLKRIAEEMGLPGVPYGELVRWTETHQEFDGANVECLTDAGFPARLSWGGGIVFDPGVPPEQDQALDLALYTCLAKYTGRPEILADFNNAQLGILWDYWTEAYVPCLEANGVGIPEDPPTRESFIAEFYTDSRWWPEECIIVRLPPP